MLNQLIDNLRWLGVAQAAVSSILVLIMIVIARRREIHLEKETLIAMIFASSGLTSVFSILLVRTRIFSPAMQLLLQPKTVAETQ